MFSPLIMNCHYCVSDKLLHGWLAVDIDCCKLCDVYCVLVQLQSCMHRDLY